MRNKNTHILTIKGKLNKKKGIFVAFNQLQFKYECYSIIGKLVDEEYFKNKIINIKLICEALGISINTLRHLPKLRQLIIDIEIKYNGWAFYRKNYWKIIAKIKEDT